MTDGKKNNSDNNDFHYKSSNNIDTESGGIPSSLSLSLWHYTTFLHLSLSLPVFGFFFFFFVGAF